MIQKWEPTNTFFQQGAKMSDKKTIDMTTEHEREGWAVYLPAFSTYYLKQYAGFLDDETGKVAPRWPAGLPKGPEGMDFLDSDKGEFYYKWALYSAGHADVKGKDKKNQERMVIDRNKEATILVGDSGGYQFINGNTKPHFELGEVHESIFKQNVVPPKYEEFRNNSLRWLESNFDYAMTLDVPAVCSDALFRPKSGIETFDQTIDLTLDNLHYFIEHRTPGKGKFLNVLSASDVHNSKIWYDSVIKFSDPDFIEELGFDRERTLEGFAFAGMNTENVTCLMERIADLIDDGLLGPDKKWIHILGTSRLTWTTILTAIQRGIRAHHSPELTVSCDSASPFTTVPMGGLFYSHNVYNSNNFVYKMLKGQKDPAYVGSQSRMPYGGPIFENCTLGDICPDPSIRLVDEKARAKAKEKAEAKGEVYKEELWDRVSYSLGMQHNVYQHIAAVQESNRLLDIEYARLKPDYRDWNHSKKSAAINKMSDLCPAKLLMFASFAEEFFKPELDKKARYAMIANSKHLLDEISFGGQKSTNFNSLFDG